MNLRHHLRLVPAIALVGCAGAGPKSSVTGTWATEVKLERCGQCSTRFGFDLYENPQGLVTGIGGFDSQSSQDAVAGAEYLSGPRTGDSIHLLFSLPCVSQSKRKGFRGRIAAAGDSLYGVFWEDLKAGLSETPLALHRGPVDTTVLATFVGVRDACK